MSRSTVQSDQQPYDEYWISYNYLRGAVHDDFTHMFALSVVLDAGSWTRFSGLRIVIVHRADYSPMVSPMSISECPDDYRSLGLGWRSYLVKQSQAMVASKRMKKLLDSSKSVSGNCEVGENATRTNAPLLFELVFELAPWQASSVHDMNKVAFTTLSKRDLVADRHRILYDRIYPYSGDAHSVTAYFRSNLFIHDPTRNYHSRPRSFFSPWRTRSLFPKPVTVHQFRILPVNRPASPCNNERLTPCVIRRIIRFVISLHRESLWDSWRQALLSMALVCKSWSHVVDLFFETHDEDTDRRFGPIRPAAISVARSLGWNPERGSLMRRFSPWCYEVISEEDRFGEKHLAWSRALVQILNLARSVRTVDFPDVHQDVFDQVISALSTLEKVKEFSVEGRALTSIRSIRISEVQRLISRWPELKMLKITCWASDDQSGLPDEISGQACNIRELDLSSGIIHGSQLVRFIQSPQPCLYQLHLENISGAYNHDLFEFLSAVSKTIVSIVIKGCDIPRRDSSEEYAMDSVMPSLSSIKNVAVSGDLASSLAIARKTSPGLYPANIWIECAPALNDANDIASAVMTAHWRSIFVGVECPVGELEKTKQVATSRGIDFRYWSAVKVPFST